MNKKLIKDVALSFFSDIITVDLKNKSNSEYFEEWWNKNRESFLGYDELKEKLNILEHSNKIIFDRGEEKNRKYGPFSESMSKAAIVASQMTDKNITTEDMFKCLIALKISRLSYNHDYDTVLDCIGYLAGLDNFIKER